MKKLISLFLTFLLVMSSVVSFAAVDPANITNISDVPVDTEIMISKNGTNFEENLSLKNVTNFTQEYDLLAAIDMTDVNQQLVTLASLNAVEALDASVSGEFDIKVIFPVNLLQMDFYYNYEFYLDEATTDKVFEDFFVLPANNEVEVNNKKEIIFKIKLVDGLKGSDIFEIIDGEPVSLLGDSIYLRCDSVAKPSKLGTYVFKGEVTGYTDIVAEDESRAYHITYDFVESQAKLTLSGKTSNSTSNLPQGIIKPSTPSTPSTPSIPVYDTHKVVFNVGSGATVEDADAYKKIEDKTHNTSAVVTLPEGEPKRDGFVFQGWYANGKKVDESVTITEDVVISAKWINLTPAKDLNADDHVAYIKGYPEGDVRPEANITREEVATIFYRLLSDEKLAEIKTNENEFSDVETDRWSVNAISTLSKGGYIKGYEDGSFKPENNITRAEFVTIASRFINALEGLEAYYNDVAGHWAEDYIALVSDQAWISGYDDGSFRPDNTITRSEVMRIVNSMLVRYTNKDNMSHEEIIHFPDNLETAWYYFDVVEATNGHDHDRHEDGYNELWLVVETQEIID